MLVPGSALLVGGKVGDDSEKQSTENQWSLNGSRFEWKGIPCIFTTTSNDHEYYWFSS